MLGADHWPLGRAESPLSQWASLASIVSFLKIGTWVASVRHYTNAHYFSFIVVFDDSPLWGCLFIAVLLIKSESSRYLLYHWVLSPAKGRLESSQYHSGCVDLFQSSSKLLALFCPAACRHTCRAHPHTLLSHWAVKFPRSWFRYRLHVFPHCLPFWKCLFLTSLCSSLGFIPNGILWNVFYFSLSSGSILCGHLLSPLHLCIFNVLNMTIT